MEPDNMLANNTNLVDDFEEAFQVRLCQLCVIVIVIAN